MPYSTLRYDVSDAGVATIALDQPDTRNALSDELLGELVAALESARDDDAVRCVVLTSTHEKVFSAGAQPRRLRGRCPACPQALRDRALPADLHVARAARQALDLRRQRPCAGGRARDRARVRPDHRARGGAVRHAGDQRRRLPVHDHGADLPQRAAQEDERTAAARRADLGRGGRTDRDRQPRRAGRSVRRDGVASGPRSLRRSRR